MFTVQQGIQAFLMRDQVENLTGRTKEWHQYALDQFHEYLLRQYPEKDAAHLELSKVLKTDIQQFIAMLQNRETLYEENSTRKPVQKKLSPFTVQGYARVLKTFFRWALAEEFITHNPVQGFKNPKVPKPIKPRFELPEIEKLLKACDADPREELGARNKAIVMLLLDTGVRASELCSMTMDRIDSEMRRIHVTGKGLKDRYVMLGARTRQQLFLYINRYRPIPKRENAIFLTMFGKPFAYSDLAHVLHELGTRAGVLPCNPHRFRHTAARLYLKNGGDIATLQQMLGHEQLATTSIYLRQEREDLEKMHERVSPVDRLGK